MMSLDVVQLLIEAQEDAEGRLPECNDCSLGAQHDHYELAKSYYIAWLESEPYAWAHGRIGRVPLTKNVYDDLATWNKLLEMAAADSRTGGAKKPPEGG